MFTDGVVGAVASWSVGLSGLLCGVVGAVVWGGRSGAFMGCAVGVGQGVAAPLFPPPPEVLWPLGHRGLHVQSAEIKIPPALLMRPRGF